MYALWFHAEKARSTPPEMSSLGESGLKIISCQGEKKLIFSDTETK